MSLDGKRVLIRCDDILQLIRALPLACEHSAEVIVLAPESLLTLVDGRQAPSPVTAPIRYVATGEGACLPENDVIIDAQTGDLDALELPRDHTMRVGVAWGAIPFAVIRRMAAVTGVTFYALEPAAPQHGPFVVMTEQDLVHTARLIRALDLVISIDALPAHLAAALGIPVWPLRAGNDGWEPLIDGVIRDLRAQTRKSHIRIDVDDHSTYLPFTHSL